MQYHRRAARCQTIPLQSNTILRFTYTALDYIKLYFTNTSPRYTLPCLTAPHLTGTIHDSTIPHITESRLTLPLHSITPHYTTLSRRTLPALRNASRYLTLVIQYDALHYLDETQLCLAMPMLKITSPHFALLYLNTAEQDVSMHY